MINKLMLVKFARNMFFLGIMLHSSAIWAQEYNATLHWSQKTDLGTIVSGIVDKVYVNAGDVVSKGDKLVQLDDAVFKAHVVEYKAKLRSADEELKEAERERDRALELYDRTVLSQHELQVAKNNYITAKARYEKVNAAYTAKKFDLKYSTIRAPFDAVILARNAQPGQVIATEFKQEPLITVAAANMMLATVLVGEDKLAGLHKGKAAKVSVGSKTFSGKIHSIGLDFLTDKNGSRGYPVDIEFEVKNVILRSGQSAKVTIE